MFEILIILAVIVLAIILISWLWPLILVGLGLIGALFVGIFHGIKKLFTRKGDK